MTYTNEAVIILILAMAAATYLPRLLPLLLLSRRRLPLSVERWLSYVPVAVLAALLGPILLLPEGSFTLELSPNPYFWAALPTFAAAVYTRNMFITVIAGVVCMALLRLILS